MLRSFACSTKHMLIHTVWVKPWVKHMDGMHHMRLTYSLMTNGSPSDPSGYGIPDEDSNPSRLLSGNRNLKYARRCGYKM